MCSAADSDLRRILRLNVGKIGGCLGYECVAGSGAMEDREWEEVQAALAGLISGKVGPHESRERRGPRLCHDVSQQHRPVTEIVP